MPSSLAFIELPLHYVFNHNFIEFANEGLYDISRSLLGSIGTRVIVILQHGMDSVAIVQRGGGSAGNLPIPPQLELHGTGGITLDRIRAQHQIIGLECWRQKHPRCYR